MKWGVTDQEKIFANHIPEYIRNKNSSKRTSDPIKIGTILRRHLTLLIRTYLKVCKSWKLLIVKN
jgi:hypothetical protein